MTLGNTRRTQSPPTIRHGYWRKLRTKIRAFFWAGVQFLRKAKIARPIILDKSLGRGLVCSDIDEYIFN
jgi:hypothetical protein